MSIIGEIYFDNAKDVILNNEMQSLAFLNDSKAQEINGYIDSLKRQIRILGSLNDIKNNLPVIVKCADNSVSPEYKSAENILDKDFIGLDQELKLEDIMLLDFQGKVVYAFNKEHAKEFLGKKFDAAPDEGWRRVDVAGPILDTGGSKFGQIVFRADISSIYKAVSAGMGPGKSGELLLGKEHGGHRLFLRSTGAFLDSGEPFRPLEEATKGYSGSGYGYLDYRHKPVIASWRPIVIGGELYGLVNKVDEKEVFTIIIKMQRLFIEVLIIILLIAMGVVYINLSAFTKPVEILDRAIIEFSKGDMGIRIKEINGDDEIGELGRSFNKMADNLQTLTISRKELLVEIEKRKLVEEELARSNKELVQFAYVASHDLQEPLRMVSSFTQLLERKYKDKVDETAHEYIDFIVDGATRMQVLIDDLLMFSKNGNKDALRGQVDLIKVCQQILQDIHLQVDESKAVINIGALTVLDANETQMRRLFLNLIMNGIKYHSEKAPVITIACEKTGAHEWHFTVADNGIGIEEQYFDKLFILFKRLHSRKEYAGTGIGLALCKKIVENYKGRIWIESVLGQGTTFHFILAEGE